MTSAIGKPAEMRRDGFSLIEILLVLALMAIAGSMVILNFSAFGDRGDQASSLEQLTQVVRKARYLAAHDRREAGLRFESEGGRLLVERDNFVLHEEKLGPGFLGNGGGSVRFFRVPSAEGLNTPPVPVDAREGIAVVRFAPDGTCTPFVAEIDYGSGRPERYAFDPFSNLRKDLE